VSSLPASETRTTPRREPRIEDECERLIGRRPAAGAPAQPCCRSAQEIHDGISTTGGRVGIASVYRVLDSLADLRLVQRASTSATASRATSPRMRAEHHHHLVCDDCGKVEPFEDERLEAALERVDVAGHDVVLRGACDDCR
jgi:Fur family ferric uptake transcriptional regulator